MLQENKARQIFRKTNISYPPIRMRTCSYQGIRDVRFLENLARFFLVTPVLRFALLLYYRRLYESSGANVLIWYPSVIQETNLSHIGRPPNIVPNIILGPYIGQITSGKRVGTQNRKRPNRDIQFLISRNNC